VKQVAGSSLDCWGRISDDVKVLTTGHVSNETTAVLTLRETIVPALVTGSDDTCIGPR
jgi:hypothetical protein